MPNNKIILHPGKRGRVFYQHPWIFKSQIKEALPQALAGAIYSVFDSRGDFIGQGYFNPKSEISARLLTYEDEAINEEFIFNRIQAAACKRERFIRDTNAWRLVFSEADYLPGLIIDKYRDLLVVQIYTLGMDRMRPYIKNALSRLFPNNPVYEKSDAHTRAIEGIPPVKGWLGEEQCPLSVEIEEAGLRFIVDVENGHKTGFYLDQRESRYLLKRLMARGRVLDCFAYSGAFSIYAACYAADKVTAIEIQPTALALAKKNAALNNAGDKIEFIEANVFDLLTKYDKQKERFDLIILDPPSFVKRKDALDAAIKGYKEINLRAMKLLNPGGLLFTFTCSHHMNDELFLNMIKDAAYDTSKTLKIIHRCQQPPDHPVDPFIAQSEYLRGYVLSVA